LKRTDREGREAWSLRQRGDYALIGLHELSAGFVLELLGGASRLRRRDLPDATQPSVLANSLNVDHPPFVVGA
jgi:hypothetical protein